MHPPPFYWVHSIIGITRRFVSTVLDFIVMARNEEKALTLFNKWHTFKKDFHASTAQFLL
jgi:hypothetical protein